MLDLPIFKRRQQKTRRSAIIYPFTYSAVKHSVGGIRIVQKLSGGLTNGSDKPLMSELITSAILTLNPHSKPYASVSEPISGAFNLLIRQITGEFEADLFDTQGPRPTVVFEITQCAKSGNGSLLESLVLSCFEL